MPSGRGLPAFPGQVAPRPRASDHPRTRASCTRDGQLGTRELPGSRPSTGSRGCVTPSYLERRAKFYHIMKCDEVL